MKTAVIRAEPNLELQLGPDGHIAHGTLMFSLATERQHSSRSSQPPQQLDLAWSFNDMRTSRSSTSSGGARNKSPSRNSHRRTFAKVAATPHHHYNRLVSSLP
ncbi:hypothetical protein BJY52DRAFT_1214552, partial [Lactarius psammicola]